MAAGAGGGVPLVQRASFDTTGRKVILRSFIHYLVVRNKGANVGRLYFTEEDWTNDVNYVEIPVAAAAEPYGEWRGPVETAHDKYSDLYIKGVVGAADIEVVGFQRRG